MNRAKVGERGQKNDSLETHICSTYIEGERARERERHFSIQEPFHGTVGKLGLIPAKKAR